MQQQGHRNEVVNCTKNVRFYTFSCTGKEKDSETGFGYFGARYMDHELMTMWLSVDQMSDKYPSISPYAYCAWNPVKLVDPDGREIDLSQLKSSERERLVKCLSTLTGLSLFVNDEGRLDYAKDNEGMAIGTTGSKSARADLIEAIDKKNEDGSNYLIVVSNGFECVGGQNPDNKGGMIQMYCDKMKEENDCNTNGLGMVFFHELRHAVTGESDPEEGMVSFYVGSNVNTNHMVTGSVVDRVNVYRQELNMPIRLQYYARPDDGKIPFCNAMYKKGPDIRKHTIWLNINSSF